MNVPKPTTHYEDMPDGTICRVSKYRYIQSGKRAWFPLPKIGATHYTAVTIFHNDTKLTSKDYHFYENKIFFHYYLSYRSNIYITIYDFQTERK